MKVQRTEIPGLVIIEPRVFEDARGFLIVSYQAAEFSEAGLNLNFVQEIHSRSCHGTLRGLHYQTPHPQGKLVRVVRGEVYDVVVDLRRDSPAFGRWSGVYLNDTNHRQLYVPPGLAHGFCVTSSVADFVYRCTDYYHPESEHVLLWNDPQLGIEWPMRDVLLSERDRVGRSFKEAEYFHGV